MAIVNIWTNVDAVSSNCSAPSYSITRFTPRTLTLLYLLSCSIFGLFVYSWFRERKFIAALSGEWKRQQSILFVWRVIQFACRINAWSICYCRKSGLTDTARPWPITLIDRSILRRLFCVLMSHLLWTIAKRIFASQQNTTSNLKKKVQFEYGVRSECERTICDYSACSTTSCESCT